ncbi:MAG: hypothetical protein F7B17_05425 [Desulfurococcales archaeon]|nr:hypothetical protein [Desulfurococcales archaeon]
MGRSGSMKVKMSVALVAAVIAGTGKSYITVREASRLLGVSTKTAGKILAKLEEEGYLVRRSRRAYKVVALQGEVRPGSNSKTSIRFLQTVSASRI